MVLGGTLISIDFFLFFIDLSSVKIERNEDLSTCDAKCGKYLTTTLQLKNNLSTTYQTKIK